MSNIHILWEMPYISSQNIINVNDNKIGYQMVLKGVEQEKKYYSISRIKVFPRCIHLKGESYNFTSNPLKNISETRIGDKVFSVEWKDLCCKKSILTKKELTKEEQLNLHLVMLENYIENSFLPEIYLKATGIIP